MESASRKTAEVAAKAAPEPADRAPCKPADTGSPEPADMATPEPAYRAPCRNPAEMATPKPADGSSDEITSNPASHMTELPRRGLLRPLRPAPLRRWPLLRTRQPQGQRLRSCAASYSPRDVSPSDG